MPVQHPEISPPNRRGDSPEREREREIRTVRLGRAKRGPREDFLGGLKRQDVNTCVLSRERRCQAGRTEVTRCNLRQPTSAHQASGSAGAPDPAPPALPRHHGCQPTLWFTGPSRRTCLSYTTGHAMTKERNAPGFRPCRVKIRD